MALKEERNGSSCKLCSGGIDLAALSARLEGGSDAVEVDTSQSSQSGVDKAAAVFFVATIAILMPIRYSGVRWMKVTSATGVPMRLKKHTALISIDNKLSVLQQRALNAMMYVAARDLRGDPKKEMFECSLSDLRTWIGHTRGGKNRGQLEAELKLLRGMAFEGNLIPKAKAGTDDEAWWVSFNYIAELRISPTGKVEYAFPPSVRQAINNPRPYCMIDLTVTRGLGRAAAAIYEICLDWCGARVPELSIGIFKKLLGCHDYRTGDFIKKIVGPAVETINTKTSLRIAIDYVADGITIGAIRITVLDSKALPGPKELTRETLIAGIPENLREPSVFAMIDKWIGKRGLDYVASNIGYTLSKPFRDFAPYLANTLNKDRARPNRERAAARAKKIADAQAVRAKACAKKESARITKAERRRLLDAHLALDPMKQQDVADYLHHNRALLSGKSLEEKLAFYVATPGEFGQFLANRQLAEAEDKAPFGFDPTDGENLF